MLKILVSWYFCVRWVVWFVKEGQVCDLVVGLFYWWCSNSSSGWLFSLVVCFLIYFCLK